MKTKIVLGIVLACSLYVLTGCIDSSDDQGQMKDPIILKTYKAPDRSTGELDIILNNLLFHGEQKVGRASITPDGLLMVAAPKGIQDGVKDMLEQLNNNDVEPSPPVEINYWIVGGRQAATPAMMDEFNVIKPALEEIQNKYGNMEFKLIDHVVTSSMGRGERTLLNGARVMISQFPSAFSDRSVVVRTSITLTHIVKPKGIIDTTIEAKSGELIVLGQLSQSFTEPIFKHEKEGKEHNELVDVYYILSADVKK